MKFINNILNNENKLNPNIAYFFKFFLNWISIFSLFIGLFVALSGFDRIFGTNKNTVLSIIFYFIVIIYFIDIIVFIILSLNNKIFSKDYTPFMIVSIYTIILLLFVLISYLFTEQIIDENGKVEVITSIWSFIFNFFVILPIYGIFDYYVSKYIRKKLIIIENKKKDY